MPHLSMRISRTLRVEVKERKVERKTAMKEESPMAKEWRRCSTSFSSVPAFTHCERETDLDCRRERENQSDTHLGAFTSSFGILFLMFPGRLFIFHKFFHTFVMCYVCEIHLKEVHSHQ